MMKKFEVGKIYRDDEGVEIEAVKRTDKTIFFRFTKNSWFEKDTEKVFKRKISFENLKCETIHFGSHWSDLRITAKEEA